MSVKIAYIKGDSEPRELKGTWMWEDLKSFEHDCYSPARSHHPNAGQIYGWQCDFYDNYQTIPNPREQLKQYDIIITLKSFLRDVSKFRADQIWLNYECEPFASHGWSLDGLPNVPGLDALNPRQSQYVGCTSIANIYTDNIPAPYDALLNCFIPPKECSDNYVDALKKLHPDIPTTYKHNNISFPHRWVFDTARKLVDQEYNGNMSFKELHESKTGSKIWVTCRTLKFHTSDANQNIIFAGDGRPLVITNDQIDMSMFDESYEYVFERTRPWTHQEYYKHSGSCKYMINIDDGITPGILHGDAAVLGVISFGRKGKWFHDMLFPEYCQITCIEEAYEKIKEIEDNEDLRSDICNHIQSRLHYIDHRQSRKYLFENVLSNLS
jgi:hypothetical protein